MKITKQQYNGYVYDLGVSFFNNFFANGFLVSNCGFFVRKKRYALLVHDMEGVRHHKPKLKIMGLESKKSSTPPFFRKALENAILLILTTKSEEKLKEYVKHIHNLTMKAPIEMISFPVTCRNLKKYSDKNGEPITGTPNQVRGALLHNKLIRSDKALKSKYPEIKEGDKALRVILSPQNPTRMEVFCYMGDYPEDVLSLKYVDREEMYNKGFKTPLTAITTALNWQMRDNFNLLDVLI